MVEPGTYRDSVATVRLRLFAAAREAAGRGSDTVDGSTVAEVLEHARTTYGSGFGAVLDTARVWLNGDEPALGPDTVLVDGDELAVLPPVSGGSGREDPCAASGAEREIDLAGPLEARGDVGPVDE